MVGIFQNTLFRTLYFWGEKCICRDRTQSSYEKTFRVPRPGKGCDHLLCHALTPERMVRAPESKTYATDTIWIHIRRTSHSHN
jgi:hypothetical protein